MALPDYSRQKQDYIFAKKNGICVNCKTNAAEPGKTLCIDCAEKSRIRNAKARAVMTDEKRQKMYEQNAARNRNRYAERKLTGTCVQCGKRKAVRGKTLCIDCLAKNRRTKDSRWNNDIPRSERSSYGLCYICGKPIEKHGKLCDKHYDFFRTAMVDLNANPTEAMLKNRERRRKEIDGFWREIRQKSLKNG